MKVSGGLMGSCFIREGLDDRDSGFGQRGLIYGQAAEYIDMGLGFSWTVMNSKIMLLQGCRPSVEESRPHPHRLESLKRIIVCEDIKLYSH